MLLQVWQEHAANFSHSFMTDMPNCCRQQYAFLNFCYTLIIRHLPWSECEGYALLLFLFGCQTRPWVDADADLPLWQSPSLHAQCTR